MNLIDIPEHRKIKMLKADYDFLALERAQRAQAQFPSDISETSSQPELEEEEEEIEEIEDCDTKIIISPLEKEVEVEVEAKADAEAKVEAKAEVEAEAEVEAKAEVEAESEVEAAVNSESEDEIKIVKIHQESSPILDCSQQKQEQALELLKSAFEQIKLALSLLDEQKAGSQKLHQEISTFSKTLAPVAEEPIVPVTVEDVAPNVKETFASKAKKTISPVAEESIVIKAAESVAPVAAEPIVHQNAKETFASKAKKPIVLKAVEPSKMTDEDNEFQVVMPKKSKTKSATIIVTTPFTTFVVEKKDDFPSLGSSFSPVQKTGFWNSGKNSLEIAKSIAQIPSPPPTRSPTLTNSNKSMKVRASSRGPIDEDDDYCNDEFKIRKHVSGNDEDDESYWE